MLCSHSCTLKVVNHDGVEVFTFAHLAVDEHHGNAGLLDVSRGVVVLSNWSNDDAVHATNDFSQDLRFTASALTGVVQLDGEPMFSGDLLHSSRHCREKWVTDVRYHQRQRLGLAGFQGACCRARREVQCSNRLGNPVRLTDAVASQVSRNGGSRDAGANGHVGHRAHEDPKLQTFAVKPKAVERCGQSPASEMGLHMSSIAVIGSTMMDMIAYVDRIPVAGETLVGHRFALGFGGKGANQAVAAARFGSSVAMINAVGSDDFGAMHIANFAEQGVNTDHVTTKAGSSGVAPIWVEADGTNRIIIVPGANELLTQAEVVQAINTLGSLDVVIGQFEIPQNVTAAAFAAAAAKGAVTVLNPAPSAPITADLLEVSDWLIPNEVEFAALHPRGLTPDTDEAIVEFANAYGVRVCVTLGAKGAALVTRQNTVVRIAAATVEAVDTTGAGDCFVGGFAHGLASGLDEEMAVTLGCAGASLSVQRSGTQTSFPTPDEAVQMWKQIHEH